MHFENFILTLNNFISNEDCEKFIECFERLDKLGHARTRKQFGDKTTVRADNQVFLNLSVANNQIDATDMEPIANFYKNFWDKAYKIYTERYGIIEDFHKHSIRFTKIQKTNPEEGYHTWHCEDSCPEYARRILTFILYLNDIDDGGETEFLYYSKRIKPEMGKFIMWPAGFTHTHRGNPPLTQTKYILTGWLEIE